jgi:hypothetical protein
MSQGDYHQSPATSKINKGKNNDIPDAAGRELPPDYRILKANLRDIIRPHIFALKAILELLLSVQIPDRLLAGCRKIKHERKICHIVQFRWNSLAGTNPAPTG